MSEIDPVILELRADLERYRADIRQITSEVTTRLGLQESAVKSLEDQFRRSSADIGGTLRGLAATIAAAFSVQQIKEYIDNYTRLQNSLKVSGLEGQKLVEVQSELLALSKQYGVSINELADLYGKSSQAAADLGASSQKLLEVTEASAQALKITGTSAVNAQGALLGLTQALSSGIVRAEEFNQINEGGLRPLLQAAANAERFGGSVAKLRAAVVDGKFTSQEFYQAILNGSQQLESQASKAVLTLKGAFTALGSALTVYIGQSAEANGATAAVSGAILALAENLDTLANVIATIAVFIAGRYVGALAAATGAALATARANVILAAAATGAGTSMQIMGIRAALAGRAILAAFGGPVGLAVTALTLGIGYLAVKLGESSRASRLAAEAAQQQADAQNYAADIADKLTRATENQRRATIAALKAAREKAAEDLRAAKAALTRAQAELALARAVAQKRLSTYSVDVATGVPTLGATPLGSESQLRDADPTYARLSRETERLDKNTRLLDGQLQKLDAGIKAAGAPVALAPIGGSDEKKKGRSRSGRSGPSAEEIEDRFNAELASIAQQTLSARQSLATSADERAELELRSVELARQQALASLEAEKDYSDAQKARIKDALENLADFERERVERDRRVEIEQDRADLADAQFRAESDALRNQYDLAQTDDDRRAIALRILEAEDAYLRSKLEAVIANQDLTEAVRQQAQIELNALNASAGDRRQLVLKANQGALDRYLEGTADTKARVEEAMVRQLQEVNDGITDALTESLGIKNRFVKDLFSIFLDEVIFRPLAEALRNQQAGGGGNIFSAIGTALGSFFGRASGGYVGPGQTVRVNEHRGGAEYLRMGSKGGTVIPLGDVNAQAARPQAGGGVTVVRLALSGDIDARIDSRAAGVAVEVVREAAPAIADAGAQKALNAASRPKL